MARDIVLEAMLRAARLHLKGRPACKPDDITVKYVMATAAPTHNAQQQQTAISTLLVEFPGR